MSHAATELVFLSSGWDEGRSLFPARLAASVSGKVQIQATTTLTLTATDGEWQHGAIKKVGEKYGFIQSTEGESFYFDPTHLFSGQFLVNNGDRVVFKAMDAVKDGQNKRAVDIFVLGQKIKGIVRRLCGHYAFAEIRGQGDASHLLYIISPSADPWRVGDEVECIIGVNRMGPIGHNVTKTGTHEEE